MFPKMIKQMEKVELEKFSFYMTSDKAFITFAEIPKGSYIEPHTHEKPVCNYIVSGILEIRMGDNLPILYQSHEWFEIQPGTSHSVNCIEDTSMIEIWPEGISE
ncbi:cupin domain-containing protein [Legionella fallonii]|uniref:Cupin 2 conserved barrel domain-containing protein n=1 Tax=Legionella fallonii LLAP-10 TaxID=1212491 RepID=A0A098G341_9GAMM|nr:hypothetical protein [Legionella fallonii]CEG56873.1 protein of unknown function [Cupin 2 conserved barrel domain protein] [Legionella fallonii LLAP-10]